MDAQRFPRISSTDDLCRTWQIILEEQGQGLGRTLWLAWLDPLGVRDPVVAGIEDVPAQPDASDIRHIRDLLDHFTDVEAPYILFSRPGSSRVTDSDRRWAAAIRELHRQGGVERPVLRGGVGTLVSVVAS